MPTAEIADWCHEAKYAADLLQERGADPQVVAYLRNASKYFAAFKVAQLLETTEGERSWLKDAALEIGLEAVLGTRQTEGWEQAAELIRRLERADAWLDLYRALTIQE